MPYLIKEAVQFKEFIQLALHNVKSKDFDINQDKFITNDGYCQALIDKVFEISHSEIADFIKHQLLNVKDKITWINKFEKLITLNDFLFKKHSNKSRLIKIILCADLIRTALINSTTTKDRDKEAPRYINADSEDRYFSFTKTKKEVDLIEEFCEKIFFLTDEIYEYEQAIIYFINPKLKDFAEQCQTKINQLRQKKLLEEELKTTPINKNNFNKLQFNGNINQLVDIFYQLSREFFVNGKSYLDGNVSDIAQMIANSYVDKDGNNLSIDTIKTILTPSREEKRPNKTKRIDIDKLI